MPFWHFIYADYIFVVYILSCYFTDHLELIEFRISSADQILIKRHDNV